ncbi:DUF3887 domain-containing protein [Olleya sp. YS]|uniref:DUF3887 domain-containing protein n=1 Tax=Olleya sp. YS TaxID=3028318 RepID=UPI0024341178|nr:DUF3887 domain-containing protein [Olleya sp. YS]WGD33513.1 DUF3887 domain-containing protein [Olleya sp. YS]
MKKLLIIIMFLSVSFGFAQEQDSYKTIVSTFQKHFNNGDVVGIYNMFDDNFKQVLTLEKTKAYFKDRINMEALGKIKSIEYKDTVRTAHNYTVTFENGVYNAFFMIGEGNKLQSFQMDQITNKQ